MAAIRAILFDADGVVQLPKPNWRDSLETLCGDPSRTEDFLADIFAAEGPSLTGDGEFEPALAQVLRKWRSKVSTQDALQIWTQIQPSPDILKVLGSLRSSGIKTALATNQQSHRAEFMTNVLGYADHFDELLYSCELGYSKPDSAYFSSAIARISIDPQNTLFIDDHEANVRAARNYGLQAEVYHLSEGLERIHDILKEYGLGVA